jgi:hypothetical protein
MCLETKDIGVDMAIDVDVDRDVLLVSKEVPANECPASRVFREPTTRPRSG